MFTLEQHNALLRAIDPNRVKTLRGNSYVEAWDVRRWLIRIFGFGGFEIITQECDLVAETAAVRAKDGKEAWTVIYRAHVKLILTDPETLARCSYEDAAIGDAQNQPSRADAHDQALKSALSNALKRCAVNLGDQFGLSLYRDGSIDQTVIRTVGGDHAERSTAYTDQSSVAALGDEP